MGSELLNVIDQIGLDKGLDPEVVIQALEEALSSAISRRLETTLEMVAEVDRQTGELKVSAQKRVVEKVDFNAEEITLEEARSHHPDAQIDDLVFVPQGISDLGRIAAQIAKQVIIQKVREKERDMVHRDYKDRVGELITGRVHHRDRGDLIISLGKVEAIMPKSEQIPHESFRIGDHIRAYVMEVQKASRGPQIILSRTHPEFLAMLFRLEVPEIGEGIVDIKCIVREAGERAKVAVVSKKSDVDPVGACVGVKGSRIQAIVRELRGEKIDVIEWSPDLATYVKNALSPALMEEIIINKANRHIMIIVPDDELSQAIGKKGQNVRLASKLAGWEIDIKSRSRLAEEAQARDAEGLKTTLVDSLGVTRPVADSLVEAGYTTLESLRGVGLDELKNLKGIGGVTAERIVEKARKG